jgi:hypothetical protein
MPVEVIAWKTALGRGRSRPDSLIVIMKGGHLCCLHGSRVSCCQVNSAARCIFIRISRTPSDMDGACSWYSNVELDLHNCWLRILRLLLATL